MSSRFRRITPFLWFDHQAEEAAVFYTSIFDDSRILSTTRFSKAGAQSSIRRLSRRKFFISTVPFGKSQSPSAPTVMFFPSGNPIQRSFDSPRTRATAENHTPG